MRKEGQIILEQEAAKKKKIKTEIRVEFKRLIFYIIVAIFIYILLSYSYKLILAYQDFYHLIDTYSQDREGATQNNILVETPAMGQEVAIPFEIKGKARTFGNLLVVQIRDHTTGEILFQEKRKVTPPTKEKQFGDFSVKITKLDSSLSASQNIILELYLESSEGSKSNLVTIPLQLQ